MNRTHRESYVEITVRRESSPIVEIILKHGVTSLFRTTLSFPNMAMAEEYAQYMARGMGETSYCCSTGSKVFVSDAETASKSFTPDRRKVRSPGTWDNWKQPNGSLVERSRLSRRKLMS